MPAWEAHGLQKNRGGGVGGGAGVQGRDPSSQEVKAGEAGV